MALFYCPSCHRTLLISEEGPRLCVCRGTALSPISPAAVAAHLLEQQRARREVRRG